MKPGKKKRYHYDKKGLIHRSIDFPPDLYERLTREKKEDDRSIQKIVIKILRRFFAEKDLERQKRP